MDNTIEWYAIFVLTGEEDKVKQRLEYRFKDELRFVVPKRILKERKDGVWREKVRNLFPGYVLVNGQLNTEVYYRMKAVPGMVKLLGDKATPSAIPPGEIEVLGRLVCNDELIGFSDILLKSGKVIVVDGPLTSMEGHIISINRRKGRAKVQVTFMGEIRTVELGINILEPNE